MTTPPNADAGQPATEAPADAGQSQTVEVPLSAIADAQEGDTVQFQVVSRDDQNGVAALAPVAAEAPEPTGGTDDMAAQFGKEKLQQA